MGAKLRKLIGKKDLLDETTFWSLGDEILAAAAAVAIKSLLESTIRPDDQNPTDDRQQVGDTEPFGGWALVDFPRSLNQAQLLETELTGYVVKKRKPAKKGAPPSSLLEGIDLPSPSGIDLVLRLDISDEECIKREGPESEAEVKEKLTAYESTYDELDQWYSAIGVLKSIDGTLQPKEICLAGSEHIHKIMEKQGTSESIEESASPSPPDALPSAPSPEAGSEMEADWMKFEGVFDPEIADNMSKLLMEAQTQAQRNIVQLFYALQSSRLECEEHFLGLQSLFLQRLRKIDPRTNEMILQFREKYDALTPKEKAEPAVKDELQTRVLELADMIWSLSATDRMNSCDALLHSIRTNGWLSNQCAILAVYYIFLLQQELNIYSASLQTIQAYFLASVGVPVSLTTAPGNTAAFDVLDPIASSDISLDPVSLIEQCCTKARARVMLPSKLMEAVEDQFKSATAVKTESQSLSEELETHGESSAPDDPEGMAAESPQLPQEGSGETVPSADGSKGGIKGQLPYFEPQIKALLYGENSRFLEKVELILTNATTDIGSLKLYFEKSILSRLDEWLGLRIEGEAKAIDHVTSKLKQCVALEQKSPARLRITTQQDAFLNQDILLRPLNGWLPNGRRRAFTIEELSILLDALLGQVDSEDGIISTRDLDALLVRFVGKLPRDTPLGLAAWNVGVFAQCFASGGMIDWRRLLVNLALPQNISVPSSDQLMDMLDAFQIAASGKSKVVEKEMMQVPFWFEPSAIGGLQQSETSTLKSFFFRTFAIPERIPRSSDNTSDTILVETQAGKTRRPARLSLDSEQDSGVIEQAGGPTAMGASTIFIFIRFYNVNNRKIFFTCVLTGKGLMLKTTAFSIS